MNRVVGISDMIISTDPKDVLVTYALGSCLGITVYDAKIKVGGLLHIMLPQSSIDPRKAIKNPYIFVDTGVEQIFSEFEKHGSLIDRLIIKVAGGSSFTKPGDNDLFEIGRRNFTMFRKILWTKGLLIKSFDIGGNVSRNISINIDSGIVIVKSEGIEKLI